MISRQVKTALLASTIITCAFASEGFADTDNGVVASVIANLNLKDGTTLQFQENKSGGLTVEAQGRARNNGLAAINGVNIDRLSRLDPVDLYKAVTGGSAAPAALVAAQQRATAAARQNSNVAAPAAEQKLPSAAENRASPATYCPYDVWRYCYPGIYGSYYYQRYTYYMRSYVYNYRGYSVYHKLSRWYGYWSYAIGQYVGAGNWGWIAAWGGSYYKRVDVYGSNSYYAWSISGH